jgi:hypothetical protein
MSTALTASELSDLVHRVFAPRATDRALAVLIDLPDDALPDRPVWAERRALAAGWVARLREVAGDLGLERVDLVAYRNVRRNNADLPDRAWILGADAPPAGADACTRDDVPMTDVLDGYELMMAPTQLSATAPLKLLARRHGFRAATMPGFEPSMVPALRLDWTEIDARCRVLKDRLDAASGADLRFRAGEEEHALHLDLRHRTATASGGLLQTPGTAGNLPSGETYIVPYEGERDGDPSRTEGTLPLELNGELLAYRIRGNRVQAVDGDGPEAARERDEMEAERAYRNVAELGLGILRGYGIAPVGSLLLDEKLGLHVAFGRSDHFGGTVGAKDFSAPDKVIHLDRVYIPEVQPGVRVLSVDLVAPDGSAAPLIRDGAYV